MGGTLIASIRNVMDSHAVATFDRRPMQVTAIGNARVLTEKGYAVREIRRKVSENQHLLLFFRSLR
jgi:hypothetical protein